MAILRVDDDGCSNLSLNHSVCRALVEPEAIVAADSAAPGFLQSFKERMWCARIAAHWRCRAIWVRGLVIFVPALGFGFLQSFCSFLCQEGRSPGLPLERRHRGQILGALQVRMSIRPAGQ